MPPVSPYDNASNGKGFVRQSFALVWGRCHMVGACNWKATRSVNYIRR